MSALPGSRLAGHQRTQEQQKGIQPEATDELTCLWHKALWIAPSRGPKQWESQSWCGTLVRHSRESWDPLIRPSCKTLSQWAACSLSHVGQKGCNIAARCCMGSFLRQNNKRLWPKRRLQGLQDQQQPKPKLLWLYKTAIGPIWLHNYIHLIARERRRFKTRSTMDNPDLPTMLFYPAPTARASSNTNPV